MARAWGKSWRAATTLWKATYKQPEETARAMRGGWFHSGDLAVVHPDGYIEVVDRAKM
jgi:fatty-acyl-CoA synthase